MTLILALHCNDGIVMGADSASTDSETLLRQPSEKVSPLGTNPILYGASGDMGLMQKIRYDLAQFAMPNNLKNIRKSLKKLVLPELAEAVQTHVPYPDGRFHAPPVAVFLFAGIQSNQPWIIEVERNGQDTCYDMSLGGFAAIGSGKTLAQALVRPHLFAERDLAAGKVIAYRVLKDAIEMAGSGLAEPIHLHTISLHGEIASVSPDERRVLEETCAMWKQMERECLGRVLAPPPGGEPAPPDIPRPNAVSGGGARAVPAPAPPSPAS